MSMSSAAGTRIAQRPKGTHVQVDLDRVNPPGDELILVVKLREKIFPHQRLAAKATKLIEQSEGLLGVLGADQQIKVAHRPVSGSVV